MTTGEQILSYLRTVESASKEEIYQNIQTSYYANWQKHLGDALSRLVKAGKVERLGRGSYAWKGDHRIRKEVVNPDQMSLF